MYNKKGKVESSSSKVSCFSVSRQSSLWWQKKPGSTNHERELLQPMSWHDKSVSTSATPRLKGCRSLKHSGLCWTVCVALADKQTNDRQWTLTFHQRSHDFLGRWSRSATRHTSITKTQHILHIMQDNTFSSVTDNTNHHHRSYWHAQRWSSPCFCSEIIWTILVIFFV